MSKLKKQFQQDWLFILLILIMVIAGIVVYPKMPDKMATHWNSAGEADGFMPKFIGIFLLPAISIFLYVTMVIIPLIDPEKSNYRKFKGAYRWIWRGLVTFLTVVYLVSLMYNLGYGVDITLIAKIGLGLLFIIIGNFTPQVRHNYFLGIRTPWTLADSKVWRKTHYLAGRLYFGAGVLLLVLTFLIDFPIWLTLVLILAPSLLSIVYAYYLYQKDH